MKEMIKYEVGSLVPHVSDAEFDSMKRILSIDNQEFEFDSEYLSHIKMMNGGRPTSKYFQTKAGETFPVDRFLNYSDTSLLTDRHAKVLNANVFWATIEDRLNEYLLPFAVLPAGDVLCFDYSTGYPPSVVLWMHETSEEGNPDTREVSSSFKEFVEGLSEKT